MNIDNRVKALEAALKQAQMRIVEQERNIAALKQAVQKAVLMHIDADAELASALATAMIVVTERSRGDLNVLILALERHLEVRKEGPHKLDTGAVEVLLQHLRMHPQELR